MIKSNHSFSAGYGSSALAFLKVLGFFSLILAMVPVHLLFYIIPGQDPFLIPRYFHRMLLLIIGMRVHVKGFPTTAKPTLFVSNHTSYLDIPVLGSILSASFIAKSEVGRWPLIGFLSKLQKTIFIERRAAKIGDQRHYLSSLLREGRSLILFPEGTSSLGLTALPFKSSLFSIVADIPKEVSLVIQPISLTVTQLDGLPIMRGWRSHYAWYGDMTFVDHLWNAFKMGRFTVEVTFHEPFAVAQNSDRKELAKTCHTVISCGIEQALISKRNKDPISH